MSNFDNMLEIATDAIPNSTRLTYIDYQDHLDDEQVELLVEGGNIFEDSDLGDFIAEQSTAEAYNYAEEALDVLRGRFEDDEESLEWIDDNELDLEEYLRDEALDRDNSDPVADLARNTPDVTLMVPVIGEDDTEWGSNRKASQLVAALGSREESHYRTARELMAEAPTDLGMAYIAFKASVSDFVGGNPGGTVEVTDPVVIYGNPFTGGVWDAQFKGLTYRIDASEIMLDGSWGPTLDDVYGGYIFPSHRVEFTGSEVPTPVDPEELSHLDTLYDYSLAITR